MDCPNDRYVNDAAICQAVVGMLARIGVKVNLLAQPKAQYFAKVLKPGGYKTSFYLLGWTPGTLDSHNVMHDIMGCRDDPKDTTRGEANLGGYCNKEFDKLTDEVLQETDTAKRNLLIKQAFEIAIKDYAYIPLHQQALAWGVSKKLKVVQRPTTRCCPTGWSSRASSQLVEPLDRERRGIGERRLAGHHLRQQPARSRARASARDADGRSRTTGRDGAAPCR